MEFEVELYSSLFSSVRASNCGQFVLKQSKRNLNTEIEVLHKLQKCIYIPKLIDVINEHTIVIESLKNVSSNEVSLNLVGVSDSINDYIKSNHVDMSLMTFDASYISKELSSLVDEIYLEKNSEVSESIFQLKSIFYRLSSIYKKLKKQSFEKNLQHGDIHIGNVMKRGNDIVLIGRMLFGVIMASINTMYNMMSR
ncbi:hypothetical protein [Aeromonas jandaei]|uniref:hypothetical protein n=1 Tax=Aeromonas jandaei TaxID=650 RepID=UPI001115D62E|nr:hypothetical protein [Aeromonas jandaei]TNI04235.1 hypothetical protein CF104_08240 [Aeromonas jandaei]